MRIESNHLSCVGTNEVDESHRKENTDCENCDHDPEILGYFLLFESEFLVSYLIDE